MDARSPLSPSEWLCLEALVDALIPPDQDPSGWAGGVEGYLIRQFASDLGAEIGAYRIGLRLLDSEAERSFGTGFAQLDLAQRTALLRDLESGKASQAWPVAPSAFIAKVAAHAAEGYYGDPGNGGNVDALSWKMIGFEASR